MMVTAFRQYLSFHAGNHSVLTEHLSYCCRAADCIAACSMQHAAESCSSPRHGLTATRAPQSTFDVENEKSFRLNGSENKTCNVLQC